MTTPALTAPIRAARADAERNRCRVLAAASDLFAERGQAATLTELARAAGVGVGTVYRHFADKEALLDALVRLAEDAVDDGVAGDAVRRLVLVVMEQRATDRGLDAILSTPARAERFSDELGRRFVPMVDRLVSRAIAAGELRDDFSGQEVCLLGHMIGKAADITRPDHPDVWRRYAQLVVDGTRPAARATRLAPDALSFAESAAALSRAV